MSCIALHVQLLCLPTNRNNSLGKIFSKIFVKFLKLFHRTLIRPKLKSLFCVYFASPDRCCCALYNLALVLNIINTKSKRKVMRSRSDLKCLKCIKSMSHKGTYISSNSFTQMLTTPQFWSERNAIFFLLALLARYF